MSKDFDLVPSQQTAEQALSEIGLSLNDIRIEELPGSYSNYTHLISGSDSAGNHKQVVMRRYKVFGDYDRGAKAQREFEAFQALERHGIPGPKPLLLDASGSIMEIPGLLCEYIDGRQVDNPSNPKDWAEQLGQTLARIHTIPCGEFSEDILLNGNPELVWFLKKGQVPEEMQWHPQGARVWESINASYPTSNFTESTVQHIDYWNGNVLWKEERIVAVLDWEEVACGDPGADVGYGRLDMFMLGLEQAAVHFLAAYEAARGKPVANLGLWQLAAAARSMHSGSFQITEGDDGKRFAAFLDDSFSRI